MLNFLTPPHRENVRKELTHPSVAPVFSNVRVPQYQFGPLPASLDAEVWSVADFASRSFPIREIPSTTPSILNARAWDDAVRSGLQNQTLDCGWLPALAAVRSWLTQGTPVYLQLPGTLHTSSPHLIGPDEMIMAVESLARFQYMESMSHTVLCFQFQF